jgi:pimeloyl-ACP methyl ester carboxylesterase
MAIATATPAIAQVQPFPAAFSTRDIATNGAVIHVRVGGKGPAVVLLHGFGDTGDMWALLAADLIRDHTVIVPDLDVVAHDIGNMVGFAFTARYPSRVGKLVLMDAPIPGIANWDELSHAPQAWHFYFYGPDEERLVAGRERIYLDRFYDEMSAHPAKVNEGIREHYAVLYARPHAMHDAFEQFKAFPQDAKDNQASLANGKLATPVLAIGGEKSYGAALAAVARAAFTNVQGTVIPDAGHWLMEEQPQAVIAAVRPFLMS